MKNRDSDVDIPLITTTLVFVVFTKQSKSYHGRGNPVSPQQCTALARPIGFSYTEKWMARTADGR